VAEEVCPTATEDYHVHCGQADQPVIQSNRMLVSHLDPFTDALTALYLYRFFHFQTFSQSSAFVQELALSVKLLLLAFGKDIATPSQNHEIGRW
jgi:hypothetical protein